jgi:hypothetical protein
MSTSKQQIPDLLFHVAKGFHSVAMTFAADVSNEKAGVEGFQRIAPAAVNMCFTAELLLKGLTLLSTKQGVRGHGLKTLFENLSPELKKLIEVQYLHYQDLEKDNKDLGAFKLTIAKTSKQNKEVSDKDNISLEHILTVHDKGFENWRYLYEIETNGFSYEIDFKSLNCFINATVDAVNSIPARPRLILTKPG